jgi:hypothetical protein
MLETRSFIQVKTGVATIGYSRDQRTEAETSRFCDDGHFEFATDAAAAEFRVHIKRSFTRVLVTFAVRPWTQTSPTDHRAVDFCDDDGMSLTVFPKPGGSLADRLRFCIKRRGRGEDRLVVDLCDRWQVCADGAAQPHGFIIDRVPNTERRTTFQVANLFTTTRNCNLLFLSVFCLPRCLLCRTPAPAE